MKRAFTLVELMIVVAILGILAAVVLPTVSSHVAKAKEASAKDNLRIVRNAIELYASRHQGTPPGYREDGASEELVRFTFFSQIILSGKYLSQFPENPFNSLATVGIVGNTEEFPAEATGNFGWMYKPASKDIRLDWPGIDSEGIQYFDY